VTHASDATMTTQKQLFQVAGLAEAWLGSPQRFAFELERVTSLFDDDEDVLNVFIAILPGSMFEGLLFVTSHRLLFVRFRLFWRQPTPRTVWFRDVVQAVATEKEDRPAVEVSLRDGSRMVLGSTKEHAARFGLLLDLINKGAAAEREDRAI
jgi:hypothetical protein